MSKPYQLSDLLEQALRAARFAPTQTAPDEAAVRFAGLALAYENAHDAARAALRSALPTRAASLLVAVAARCALESVASRDVRHLRSALIALAIADFRGKTAEIELVLSVSWYAARALERDPFDLFRELSSLCSASGRGKFLEFAAKPEEEKRLAALALEDIRAGRRNALAEVSSRSRHRYN